MSSIDCQVLTKMYTQKLNSKFREAVKDVTNIEVRAIPQYSKLTSGVRQKIDVLFQIIGGQVPSNDRDPVNISIVLDRSGSMTGPKLTACKRAIKHLISILEPTDHLHVVMYDDSVDTVLENVSGIVAQDSLQKVDSIEARGCTDILCGVKRGVELIEKHHVEKAKKIVLLFSDGLVNSGVQDPEIIGASIKNIHCEKDIFFSTFGIGSDFNEVLMSSISRCGKGNFFFIDENNVEKIPEIVEKGFTGFVRIVGTDLHFKIRGLGSSIVTELTDCENIQNGRKFEKMREYGCYQFLATLDVTPTRMSEDFQILGNLSIAEYQLQWTPNGQSDPQVLSGIVSIDVIESLSVEETVAPEYICYKTMMDCAKLNKQVNEALKKMDHTLALKLKQQIVDKYLKVEQLDKFGFVGAILKREDQSLKVLADEGINDRSRKYCLESSMCTPSHQAANRYAYEEANDLDDQDMTFGLTD